jgi:CRISPR/Cas system-associated endonuclease Cas1
LGGGNALKIIEEAIIHKEKETKEVDQYWVVFDKDETPSKDFDQAIKLALSNNIKVSWSNQAFELWIILHYQELFSPCDRRRYKEVLCKHIKDYSASEKGEEQGRRLHAQTCHMVRKAIDRAIKGYSLFEEKLLPSERESSTTVFELVNAIRKNQ